MRYFIHLAYQGSRYCGWQIQLNGRTIQGELERALGTILRKQIPIVGAGRTDSGVHAVNYFAHFDWAENAFNPDELLSLPRRLNDFLDPDIAVYKVFAVADDLHARFSASSRTYEYRLCLAKDPFGYEFSYYQKQPLDVDFMNEACKVLFEYTDFGAFAKLHSQTKTNICQIYRAQWDQIGDHLVFSIQADRFLRNMVRAIVGTMFRLGQHQISLDEFRQIIESGTRSEAGTSVPARGLFLVDVSYDPIA